MGKSNKTSGSAKSAPGKSAPGKSAPARSVSAKSAGANRATTKTGKSTPAKTSGRATSTAGRASSGASSGSGSRKGKSSKQGRQEAGSASSASHPASPGGPVQASRLPARRSASSPLRPIPKYQSRRAIITAAATESGVTSGVAERVARSLARTYHQHLMRGGSGRVEMPGRGALAREARGAESAHLPEPHLGPRGPCQTEAGTAGTSAPSPSFSTGDRGALSAFPAST